MVGLQSTVFKDKLKSKLNGIVNYETWGAVAEIAGAGSGFLQGHQERAKAAGTDPLRSPSRRLGLCLFPGAWRSD